MSSRNPRLHAKIWFACAVALSGAWLLIYFTKDDSALVREAKLGEFAEVSLPDHIEALQEFRREVEPISFDVITRDLRHYPKEFKDRNFFQKNKNKWTVQVMDVGEHKLIADYLDTRDDRDKFAYFRYTNVDNKERYILTYGLLSSFQEAMGVSKTVDFRLPSSMRTLPEQMLRYLDMVDRYERGEEAEELRSSKTVKLIAATKLTPAEPLVQEENSGNNDGDNNGSKDSAKNSKGNNNDEKAVVSANDNVSVSNKSDDKHTDKTANKNNEASKTDFEAPLPAPKVDDRNNAAPKKNEANDVQVAKPVVADAPKIAEMGQ